MDVFVKSASLGTLDGGGYIWQPDRPPAAKAIESEGRLVSDYFPHMVLWGEYIDAIGAIRGLEYSLYIGSLPSPYNDTHHRPIKHTLVWRCRQDEEALLRRIMIAFLQGNLSKSIKEHILPKTDRGFEYHKSELCLLKDLYSQVSLVGAPARYSYHDLLPGQLIERLQNHSLPKYKGLHLMGLFGPLIAVGKGLNSKILGAGSRFPELRLVCDLDLENDL